MTESIEIRCQDGTILKGKLFGEPGAKKPIFLFAGATGVPQVFYSRMAIFCALKGVVAVTFDYRGIGQSKIGPLKDCKANFVIWAEQDLAAALDWCLERGKTAVVGHSFGGQALGLIPRANETLGLYSFGSGAGYHGYMPVSEQPKVLFLWHILGPISTAWYGYLPGKRLGIGEDLPLGVYKHWRKWCLLPHYYFDDRDYEFKERCAAFTRPIVAVAAIDDRWAPPKSVRAFYAGYSNADISFVDVIPEGIGCTQIGHIGYFRKESKTLWQNAVDWLLDLNQKSIS